MFHMFLEFVPFLLGAAFGYKFSAAGVSRVIGASLIIGILSAALAGEWALGLPTAIMSILIDTAGALAGWTLVYLFRRQIVKGGRNASG